MIRFLFFVLITHLLFGCVNSTPLDETNNKIELDISLPILDSSSLDTILSPIKTEKLKLNDTLTPPISVSKFLDLNFQNYLTENRLLNRKDTIFESSYVPGDSIVWSFYRYQNSEILKLGDSSLLSIKIKNNELLEGFFIQIGMSLDEFKDLFADFETLSNKNYEEGIPYVTERTTYAANTWIRISNSFDEPLGWTIGFSNDSLFQVSHTVYYEF